MGSYRSPNDIRLEECKTAQELSRFLMCNEQDVDRVQKYQIKNSISGLERRTIKLGNTDFNKLVWNEKLLLLGDDKHLLKNEITRVTDLFVSYTNAYKYEILEEIDDEEFIELKPNRLDELGKHCSRSELYCYHWSVGHDLDPEYETEEEMENDPRRRYPAEIELILYETADTNSGIYVFNAMETLSCLEMN